MAQINTLTTTTEVVSGAEAKSTTTGRRVTITPSKRREGSLVIKAYDKNGSKVFGLYLTPAEAEQFADAIAEAAAQL